ncbi:DUF4173 domain-containing protein [Novosphingobium sp. SL115]|uniref:DUF4153 domain-containing protein n=1 Tax=Novosphingobium sp. SL115 TaxID=2995150 RepID=UPI0022759CAE|nr:DUF4173 domain-containing protein [Novosphingobium sp. SL115]MCY1670058.1 DUF4173 domain-containing protein [Novosphingobium sp. SL115]
MAFASRRWRGAWTLKVVVVAGIVALGDVLFFELELSGGTFGFYGLALLMALALAQPAVLAQRPAAIALGFAAVYALAMAFSPGPLAWLLFWTAAGMATLLPRTHGFDDGWRWFQRLAYHGLVALAGPVPDLWRRARAVKRRGHRRAGLRDVVPVLILPLIGTAMFFWLFAAANPVIERWLATLNAPGIDATMVLRALLWTVLTWFAWGLLRPHMARRVFGTFDGDGSTSIPGISPASVLLSLVLFNALFVVQNGMDAAWLWGLMPLPQGMTLAEYAHRGAYPLVVTALLAALFVLVALRPGSAPAAIPAVRRLVMLWIAQNLFLVYNAALRTVDYVEAFSLTVLRISALLWMGLVALGLVLVLWRMLKGKRAAWLINANLAAAAAVLTMACFVDLRTVAARWNIAHAREVDGDGAMLDLCYLDGLGGSALLPLIELEGQALPAPLHDQVRHVRLAVHYRLIDQVAQGEWDWLSQRRLNAAERMLGGKIGPRPALGGMMCNGLPFPPQPAPLAPPPVEGQTVPAAKLTDGEDR